MSDAIQADYEELELVAKKFNQNAQAIDNTLKNIVDNMQDLENGGWIGLGAEAFFNEMNGEVLPAVRRLKEALLKASTVTTEITQIVQNAEKDAAAPFRLA